MGHLGRENVGVCYGNHRTNVFAYHLLAFLAIKSLPASGIMHSTAISLNINNTLIGCHHKPYLHTAKCG